jgi:hypothetical protein
VLRELELGPQETRQHIPISRMRTSSTSVRTSVMSVGASALFIVDHHTPWLGCRVFLGSNCAIGNCELAVVNWQLVMDNRQWTIDNGQ